ncbi:hypothetical protein [Alienimonas sp. DA493]|uniref:hypothetical protein n=1 Tax=Alienimonas sp. DA493 TaxID=3373605 RepID=UPI003754D751
MVLEPSPGGGTALQGGGEPVEEEEDVSMCYSYIGDGSNADPCEEPSVVEGGCGGKPDCATVAVDGAVPQRASGYFSGNAPPGRALARGRERLYRGVKRIRLRDGGLGGRELRTTRDDVQLARLPCYTFTRRAGGEVITETMPGAYFVLVKVVVYDPDSGQTRTFGIGFQCSPRVTVFNREYFPSDFSDETAKGNVLDAAANVRRAGPYLIRADIDVDDDADDKIDFRIQTGTELLPQNPADWAFLAQDCVR